MTIIKLPNVGDTLTAHVTDCAEVAGNFGPQIRFTMANGDQLFISLETATRQLLRAGFDDGGDPPKVNYEAVEGNTLVFSRDPNAKAPSKPYWGITVADAFDKAAAKPVTSKRIPSPTRVPGDEVPANPDKRQHDAQIPLPDAPDAPYAPAPAISTPMLEKSVAYFALAERVATFQAELGRQHECPWDLASINAMTFSIWNSR